MGDQLLVHDAAIVQANRNPFLCFQLVAQPLRLSLTIDLQQQGLASIVQGSGWFNTPGDPRKILAEALITLNEHRLQLGDRNGVER